MRISGETCRDALAIKENDSQPLEIQQWKNHLTRDLVERG